MLIELFDEYLSMINIAWSLIAFKKGAISVRFSAKSAGVSFASEFNR